MTPFPHLTITRIYYKLVIEDAGHFLQFPEAILRGALGYYLYDMYRRFAYNMQKQAEFAQLYQALLGNLPNTDLPPEGPMPRSINLRAFPLPEQGCVGLEITYFGKSFDLNGILEQSIVSLGEEGVGQRGNRFYIDGMRPPMSIDIADILPRESDSFTLVFHTPTSFRLNRKEVRSWNLEMFSKNLLQRIELLCKSYGQFNEEEWCGETALHELLAMESDAKTTLCTRARLSTRQKKRIDYSGFTGQVTLHNVSPLAQKIIAVGELTGVGKNTTFGGGRYAIS